MKPLPGRRNLPRRLILMLLAAFFPAVAAALEPDQVVLIVNGNVPAGMELARQYARARQIPDGHIIQLNLPDADEIAFDGYERDVVPPIRQFLRDHGLDQRTACLATFYGMPLRIAAKTNSPAEKQEMADLRDQQTKLAAEAIAALKELEMLAVTLDKDFKPGSGESLNQIVSRTDSAASAIATSLTKMTDPAVQAPPLQQAADLLEKLGGIAEIKGHLSDTLISNLITQSSDPQKWGDLTRRGADAVRGMKALQDQRYDPAARAKLRDLARQAAGVIGAGRAVQAQLEYFQTDATNSSLDSELELLWWNYYPRSNWLPNPLNYRSPPINMPPALMVMRLDGPTPACVANLIQNSLRVEHEGLKGVIALNTRGINPGDSNAAAFGAYNQHIRDLAKLLKEHSTLQVTLLDNGSLFKPHSVKNVALYCGWYSLRHYVPGCDFSAGAVGFHIASLEMVSLHGKGESGWVHGLLNDGVVGTLGAVAEPYLHSFPLPDEFFPLLLTGKLTLAEVYWKTTPLASWMVGAVGDPLYNPYKADPQMKVEDLPPQLRRIFDAPTPGSGSGVKPAD